jgi:hypothetical protein
MNIFEDIKTALLGMDAVTAIFGTDDPKKVPIWNSWERVNQYPCIVMEIDREAEHNYLETGKGDLVAADATITCRANTHDQSDALQEAVRSNGTTPGTGLAGYAGTFDATLEETVHAEVPKPDGSTAYWYDHVMSFHLEWTEAA